jgi:hypothetical protein
LIIATVGVEQRLVKPQLHSMTDTVQRSRAAEQFPRYPFIKAARIRTVADWARRDVLEAAVGADSGQDLPGDIPTIGAGLASRDLRLGHGCKGELTCLPQELADGTDVSGGELEVGLTLLVSVDSLERVFGVKPHGETLDQKDAGSIGTAELLGPIGRTLDGDAERWHFRSLMGTSGACLRLVWSPISCNE